MPATARASRTASERSLPPSGLDLAQEALDAPRPPARPATRDAPLAPLSIGIGLHVASQARSTNVSRRSISRTIEPARRVAPREPLAEHRTARVDDDRVDALLRLFPARELRLDRDRHVRGRIVDERVRGGVGRALLGQLGIDGVGLGAAPRRDRLGRRRRERRRLTGGDRAGGTGHRRRVGPGRHLFVATGERILDDQIAGRHERVGMQVRRSPPSPALALASS